MGDGDIKHHADYSNFQEDIAKEEALELLLDSYTALADSQTNWVCNLSNCSSLLWYTYNDALKNKVNWAGFYLLDPKDTTQLILGPFHGKVACQTIKIGKGVCGTAASTKLTQLVRDVEKFPGHIACDGETKSEIVVPIIVNGEIRGVLDIDCLQLNGFDRKDQETLEKLCELISKSCEW